MKRIKEEPTLITSLPYDCYSEIMLFLDDFNDVISFRLTCREFNTFCCLKNVYKGTDNALLEFGECMSSVECKAAKNLIKAHELGLLKRISIYCKKFIDGGHLNKLFRLKSLKIQDCLHSPLQINRLFENLEEFECRHSSTLSDDVLACIKNVKRLDISHCRNIVGTHLHQLKRIEYIGLCGNSKIQFNKLIQLNKIRILELSECDLKDYHIDLMDHFKALESLGISDNPELTGRNFHVIKNIKSLNISYCNNLWDKCLFVFKKLITLIMFECPTIVDDSLKYLENLKCLKLSGGNITNKGLGPLKNLEELQGFFCTSISIKQLKIKKTIFF